MIIRSSKKNDLTENDVTPEDVYESRRRFLKGGAASALGVVAATTLPTVVEARGPEGAVLAGVKPSTYKVPGEKTNSWRDITSYNNFYEFGLSKSDPARHAHTLKPRPWTVVVDGLCDKPGVLDIDDILKKFTLEERIYRFRCVEAWSMVIPWVGLSLADFVKAAQPKAEAKYIAFETLEDASQMPGISEKYLQWPYREGLRLDEALNPLSLLAVGLYGRVLPNQNGAPIRLMVPWKYGFKCIKSIVRISFVDRMPYTTWNAMAPHEYGFYANVNPTVSHPRWSQARERRIGEFSKRPTLMFNGYESEVAHLYKGMDLRRNY